MSNILRGRRMAKILAVLVALTGLMLSPLPVAQGQANTLVWSRVSGLPVTVHLHDIFMVHERMAWAVGEERGSGVIYRLQMQGSTWEVAFETRVPAPLYAVAATNETNVWAVGDNGTIVQKDSGGWRSLGGAAPNAMLRTIQIFGAGEEGWAAGMFAPQSFEGVSQPALYHLTQGQWRLEPAVNRPGKIDGLHFTAGTGWAVGDNVWRYANGAWTNEPVPFACGENFPCPYTLEAVRAVRADEAWAVGSRHAICAACVTRPYVLHRVNGSWQRVADVPVGSPNPRASGAFTGASFSRDGEGLLVGWYDRGIVDPVQGTYDARVRPMIVRYRGQQWTMEELPTDTGALTAVSMIDGSHALAVGRAGLILAYGYGAQPDPAAKVANTNEPGSLYFAPVGHTLRGTFKSYWERNGGLPVFGYPLTEAFRELNSDTGQPYNVQYLERQRYEYHPELRGTPYEVLLGRLGVEVLQRHGRDWTTFPKADPGKPHFFAETGHAIAPEFWNYWSSHGLQIDGAPGITFQESLALFGYPISEPQIEVNSSGDRVLTQWFERARFEYHPDKPEPYRVLLGRLAAEVLQERGW